MKYITLGFLILGAALLYGAFFATLFRFVYSWGNLGRPINVAVWEGMVVFLFAVVVGALLGGIGMMLKALRK